LGRKNIFLKVDTEPLGDSLVLPLARVMRDGSGGFVFDPRFIPPCVETAASPTLLWMLQRLLEIMTEKTTKIGRAAPDGRERSWAEFSTRDIANFWLLHTINSALAPLTHHLATKRGHPEELYIEMLRLGGSLCTFAIESHPRTLPKYEHTNLEKC